MSNINSLQIFSDILKSLNLERDNSMHNINVLLNNSKSELDVTSKIKHELSKIASIHIQMQECQSFILQISESESKLKK